MKKKYLKKTDLDKSVTTLLDNSTKPVKLDDSKQRKTLKK